MADNPQVQPLPSLVEGGSANPGAASGAADPAAIVAHSAAAAVRDVPIHGHRLGCVLHILGGNSLHLADAQISVESAWDFARASSVSRLSCYAFA